MSCSITKKEMRHSQAKAISMTPNILQTYFGETGQEN